MALAVGDVVQIIDVQSAVANQILNVYHYEIIERGVDVTLEDIGNVFQTRVIPEMRPLQHTGTVHTSVILKNLTNNIDIFEEAISIAGTAGGEAAPNFVALSFRYVRASAVTRHGYKRIGGLAEITTVGNDPSASALTDIPSLADAMAADLEVDSGGDEDFIARPIILGRIPQDEPNAGDYDLSRLGPISGVQFVRVTSQTTRRIGRGA